ncbi:MAG TPA: hypothetical protein VM536_06200 [Chloroflexia bacterium]|nr:hypothetical protein [Chloroflexia bacterium]
MEQSSMLNSLVWRLAETIAWCAPRTVPADPLMSLRNLELLPPGYRFVETDEALHRFEPSLPEPMDPFAAEVAQRRAALLRESGTYPVSAARGPAGGRLLCYAPWRNLEEACEEPASGGFYDLQAIPPWDTWIALLHADTVDRADTTTQLDVFREPGGPFAPGTRCWYDHYIVCWVPAAFIALADAGLLTSTTACIYWADDLDAPWLRALRAAGIVPDASV